MMINSVCLPSADLGFGRGVPSPNRILNFSFKPESLLAGLAMLGKDAPRGLLCAENQAETSGTALPAHPAADRRPPADPRFPVGTTFLLPTAPWRLPSQPGGPGHK